MSKKKETSLSVKVKDNTRHLKCHIQLINQE